MAVTERERYLRWSGWTLLLLFGGCATPQTAPTVPQGPFDFELTDVQGASVRLSSLKGKVVLVDMWATWCTPCEASFPFYAALYERHRESGFEILAVSVDLEDDDVTTFLDRRPVPFQVLRDPKGTLPERLDIQTMPTAVLVGRDGQVVWVHPGFVDDDQPTIESQVVAALGSSP